MNNSLPDTSLAAWQLNEAGLHVFPLGSPFETPPKWFVEGRCGGDMQKAVNDWAKSPRFSWKKYQTVAPADADIEQWTKQYPGANWAIVTGVRVVVIDADSRDAVQFIEEGGITRTPLRAITSKGKHFYYQVNPALQIRNSVKKNKIDVRGAGGYVVAPGSTHQDGTRYQWESDDHARIDDLLDLPMLKDSDIASINSFNGSIKQSDDIPVGNLGFFADEYMVPHDGSNLAEGEGRNNAAASMAGQLIREGRSLVEIKAVLDQWNGNNTPPLPETELNTTIASIARTHVNNNPGAVVPVEPIPATQQFSFSHIHSLITNVKPISWLVKNFFEMDSLACLFGPPSCGKSFIALDLACCVATGHKWHGNEIKKPGAVFYIAGEGFNGISRRLLAWQQVNKVNLQQAPLFVSRSAAGLTDLGNARIVSESIEEIIQQIGGVIPSLIVIDTLARNFGPGDENSTQEMNVFISHIDEYLRQKYGCAVIVVHHSGVGNQNRARGNSALKGAVDAEYSVVKNDDEVKLTSKKMKDADSPEPIDFFFEPVTLPIVDEDGEQQVSCVLEQFDKNTMELVEKQARVAEGKIKAAEAGRKQAKINIGNRQKNIIKTLDDLLQRAKVNLSKSGLDPDKASIEVSGLRKECIDKKLVSVKHWSRTFNTLIERDFLEVNPPFIAITDKGKQVVSEE